MADFPRSLIEFQRRFADEPACAAYLAAARWPDGSAARPAGKTRDGNSEMPSRSP